ncbi:hypothetical protein PZH32_02560 [Adlercreutzia equolifaciens]|uniref:hypothetical protein n=1 Tax=Adlercreutzia equolifaciens TaxID=446660 RepID=UPI0023B10AA6|nr:hypothetical protein [Adlercreutzia equolifaciens]MDE8701840.1 hypothetical protein [Adlercreutzia equolifaciens]
MSGQNESVWEDDRSWEFEDYDPFASDEEDIAEPEQYGDGEAVDPEYSPEAASNLDTPTTAEDECVDDRPAAERIADLMSSMGLRAATLRRVIALCEQPRRAGDVNDHIDLLQEHTYSVFSPANLCALLERSGALQRVNEDGSPYKEDAAAPRAIVDEDGLEYLEVTQAPPVYWVATPAGLQAVANYEPSAEIWALLHDDSTYLPIYERVLRLCAQQDGATIAAISQAVDSDPLVQNPRYLGLYFVERLERVGALEWASPWRITPAGSCVLDELSAAVVSVQR